MSRWIIFSHIFFVTCNDETSIDAAERVMHRKVMQSTVTFYLKVIGVKVITFTLKTAKYCCG